MCLDIGVDLKTDHIEDEEDAEAAPKELLDLLDRHERRSQLNIVSPLKVNLGTESEPKVVFIGIKLDKHLKNRLIILLNEFKDVFAWSYEDMSALNIIVVYHLPLQLMQASEIKFETNEARVEY